jgi:hypothetical protein
MGLLDRLRGTPDDSERASDDEPRTREAPLDTQSERVEAADPAGAAATSPAERIGDAGQTPADMESSIDVARDEEAIRHQGI